MPDKADQLAFIHISDCHFGAKLANRDQPLLADTSLAGGAGQPCHDIDLCKSLLLAIEDVRLLCHVDDDAIVPVVVSGDLTASGEPSELAAAHSFLRSLWRVRREAKICPLDESVGLQLPPEALAVVPGNHDQWDGHSFYSSPAYNPSRLYPEHFRELPWRKTWVSKHGLIHLDLYGLDSNSGLPTSSNRSARGAIDPSQLSWLKADLQNTRHTHMLPGSKLVKAIALHHSLEYTNTSAFSRFLDETISWHPLLELDPTSRNDLRQIAADNDCAVILTGHTHDPCCHAVSVTSAKGHRLVHELRCASTLQGPPAGPNAPAQKRQGFLLHRIDLKDEGAGALCTWSTWSYVLDHAARFSRTEDPRWSFPLR